MVAFLFLAGAALLGISIVSRATGRFLDVVEKVLFGLVGGWALATLLAYGLASATRGLSPKVLYSLTAVMWFAAGALSFRSFRKLKRDAARPRWPSRYTGLLLIVCVFAPVFWHLSSTRMLAPAEDGLYSGGTSFYDINFHAAVASSFVYGNNFPPVYTVYPPEPLLYPFMPDFLTAVLLALGWDYHAALTATTVALLLAIVGLIYTLSLRITRSRMAASLSAVLFMLSGGFGFLHAAADWRASGKTLWQFWDGLEYNYTSMWARGFHWGNAVVDYLLPQRGSLFGVALSLMALACFARVWQCWGEGHVEREGVWAGWRPLLSAGLIAGVLPFFHTHSFVAICLMATVLTLLNPRRAWLAFWAVTIVLALPRFLELVPHVTTAAGGFLRFRPGWMGRGSGNWPLYWLKNVGVLLILVVPAWIAAPRRWKLFYLAPVCLLAFAFFFSLSPNNIDNLKLMYYWYLATCVLVSWWLRRVWFRKKLRPAVVLLVIVSTTSGVLAIRREGLNRSRVFDREDLAAAAFVRERTEPGSLFLTAPVINQPVLCLAGRPVVRGFPVWLWSHGFDVKPREFDVRAVYAGSPDIPDIVRHLGISYVYVGSAERREYEVNDAALAHAFPLIYETPGVKIYDARAVVRGDGREVWGAALATPYISDDALGRDPASLFVDFDNLAYFLYRLYRVSYGRMPRFDEFMTDMRELCTGLTMRFGGWDARLAENKRRFVGEWVERPQFVALHGGVGDAELANKLQKNLEAAGGDGGALLRAFRSGARRADLVATAADSNLSRGEYNSAFVLTHFFAYFARNPDDPPDKNFDGYKFWLDGLNSDGDYGAVSLAFIESTEYKEKARARLRVETEAKPKGESK